MRNIGSSIMQSLEVRGPSQPAHILPASKFYLYDFVTYKGSGDPSLEVAATVSGCTHRGKSGER